MKFAPLLAAAALLVAAPSASAACMQFHAINEDPAGTDSGTNAHLNLETVTLKNTCGTSQVITGWTLRDAQSHVYTFPATTVGANGRVVVHTGTGTNRQGHRYWRSAAYIWNNGGDTARLRRANGNQVDVETY